MELKYNSPTSKGGAAQFNGNISEAVWKIAGLDKQSYGYDYDPMNRIMKGRYYDLAKPTKDGNYDELMGDPADLNQYPAYDLNGNIQNLLRNGKTDVGTYGLMDKLHYDYSAGGGNKLMFVTDDQPTTLQEEGFKEAVEATSDYGYDPNGNLTKDENKGIISIEYNHLNLPSKVSKSTTEYLEYTYDATGRKLAQQVFGTQPKTTDYVGELVFEDNVLQFVLQPEGRVVADTEAGAPDPWEYQYFLKDHLGNTRVVFSEKKSSTEYKATLEDNTQADEMSMFFNYPTGGTRSSLNEFDHTDAGTTYTHSQLLTGSNTNRVGLARSFEVNPGDIFDLEVYAKYEAPSATSADITTLLSQLSSAFSLGSATSPLDGAPAQAAFDNLFQGGGPWINSSMWDDTAPKAYLNYILFDENFALVDFGFDQISTQGEQVGVTPVVPHDYLSLHVKVAQKGYLYVYLSNEQPTLTNVYFDDMKIVQYSGVEQLSDYYPFGLTFNSYSRENGPKQNYLYNGKELQVELSLGWMDYGARMYDPAIARWFVPDLLSELAFGLTPYRYCYNSPVNYTDPFGLWEKDKNGNSSTTRNSGDVDPL